MSWATIGTIATIASAAASISAMGYQAAQGAPKLPDTASASREVAQAQADALPTQRGLAAAEAQGGKYTQFVPTHKEQQQFVKISKGMHGGIFGGGRGAEPGAWDPSSAATDALFGPSEEFRYIPYKAEEWAPGGKYADFLSSNPKFDYKNHIVSRGVNVKGHDQTNDFTGYGTADITGKLAKQQAAIQEELGAKYGVQFAGEARREAEQADPLGFAARDKELSMIQDQIDHPQPINPLSTELEKRMQQRVDAGSGLDSMSKEVLDAAIARSNADRGGRTSAAGVEGNLTTGMEGAARRQAGIGQAQSFLSSGSTPEDIAYRHEQQNLANLSSFTSGQTPQSQFQNLSGAAQGTTPFYPGQPGPTMPNNAGPAGANYSVGSYLQNLRNQSGQADSWMGGLSALLNGIGTAAKAGGR